MRRSMRVETNRLYVSRALLERAVRGELHRGVLVPGHLNVDLVNLLVTNCSCVVL